jgi:HD-GYP domain-containing protein (c-di-GMP phosphodiesterase class II)
MQQHCRKGYEIIKKLPFLAEAAEIVYCHHEWYEGTGYPRGLKGEQIPIGARIVAVANTLDAITSNLPYRPARPLEVAKTEMEGGASTQFDPDVVSTFLLMPESTWSDLAKGIAAQAKQGNPA